MKLPKTEEEMIQRLSLKRISSSLRNLLYMHAKDLGMDFDEKMNSRVGE